MKRKILTGLCLLLLLTACVHINNTPEIDTGEETTFEERVSVPDQQPVETEPEEQPDVTIQEKPQEPKPAPPAYDIAFDDDPSINYWINRYTGRNKTYFRKSLYQFDKVRPRMEEIFEEHGLPKDLVYLSLVESCGNPHAVSHAGATGYWQFMPGTARRYDLRMNRWIDERRDLEKSTTAAALYLSHLYSIFDDWLLACAAYNAGEGTIKRITRRHPGVEDFWDISPKMSIKRETLAYVPKFLASLKIGKNREMYGLPSARPAPSELPYDVVTVSDFTYLDEISSVTGHTYSAIASLNPELVRGCTPPSDKDYSLKVPRGTHDRIANYLEKIHDPHVHYATHTIKSGDTLYDISRANNTTVHKIAETNRINPSKVLSIGKVLIIPADSEYEKPRRKHTYVVTQGDSLKTIAHAHGVTVQDLIEVNSLTNPNVILPKTVLNIPPRRISRQDPSLKLICYRVKKGDTIWGISRQFDVSTKDVMRWNQLSSSAEIFPGDNLSIYR